MIVLAAAVALAIAETIARGGRVDPARFGAKGTYVALASGLSLLATTIAAAISGRTSLVGLVPIAVGITLRVAAIRALGDAFTSETAFVPGRPVVTTGLHRWTRHPSDLGLLLYAGGIAVLGASAIAMAFAVVVAATILVRILEEEKAKKKIRSGGG